MLMVQRMSGKIENVNKKVRDTIPLIGGTLTKEQNEKI